MTNHTNNYFFQISPSKLNQQHNQQYFIFCNNRIINLPSGPTPRPTHPLMVPFISTRVNHKTNIFSNLETNFRHILSALSLNIKTRIQRRIPSMFPRQVAIFFPPWYSRSFLSLIRYCSKQEIQYPPLRVHTHTLPSPFETPLSLTPLVVLFSFSAILHLSPNAPLPYFPP